MAVDLKLDVLTNDLVLTDLVDFELETGPEEVAQHMTTELDTPRGQDPIDTLFGLPYIDVILVKNPDEGALTSIIRGTIAGRADVTSVPKYVQTFERGARRLLVDFEAETTEGLAAVFLEFGVL